MNEDIDGILTNVREHWPILAGAFIGGWVGARRMLRGLLRRQKVVEAFLKEKHPEFIPAKQDDAPLKSALGALVSGDQSGDS